MRRKINKKTEAWAKAKREREDRAAQVAELEEEAPPVWACILFALFVIGGLILIAPSWEAFFPNYYK